jgi:hypothetical protein
VKNKGLTLVELLFLLVLFALFGALLIPAVKVHGGRVAHHVSCSSNLKQIGTLAEIYRKNFGGRNNEVPDALGAAWHQSLIDNVSQNRDTWLLQCPQEGKQESCPDYRGPSRDSNRYRAKEILAGDKIFNHGNPSENGINALTAGWQVLRIRPGDQARWEQFIAGTRE